MTIEARPPREVFRERGLWAAVAFAVAVRVLLGLFAGRTFNASASWWQLLDAKVLREEPLTSLYYMHMQPPLYNGVFALSLALPYGLGRVFLGGLYAALSLAMTAIVYFFLRRWQFSTVAAAALAGLFSVLPQTLIFENIFLYAHLEAAFVMAAMYFAAVYISWRSFAAFVGLAASLAGLALVRALFHIAWVAVALAVVWGMANLRRPRDVRSLAVAAVSLVVVGSVYAKNYLEFGLFSVSSWQGINMSVMTFPINPHDKDNSPDLVEDLRRRADRGEVSPTLRLALAAENVWSGWVPTAKGCGDTRTPRVLCAPTRHDGGNNYNHLAMLRYSQDLGRETLHGLRLYPKLFARHVASSLLTFFGTPSWVLFKFDAPIDRYTSLWNAVMLYDPARAYAGGKMAAGSRGRILNRVRAMSLPLFVLVFAAVVVVLVKGARQVVATLRGSGKGGDWIFPALVVAAILVVPNVVNGAETNRMRYTIEPILYLALAVGVREAIALIKR